MRLNRIMLFIVMAMPVALWSFTADDSGKGSDKDGIQFFHGTWEEALKESQQTGKPIFADIYATWCGPCKWMKAKIFTDASVAEYYNEHFINVKIDAERGEGPDLARKYRVRAYPTLLYVDHKGDILLKTEGARDAEDFIDLGKLVKRKS